MDAFDDIRDHLRRDHEATLAELYALRDETDDHRARSRLQKLRRAWVTHALAEEAVVYRALEGVQATASPSDASKRFVGHSRADRLFEKALRHRAGTLEWIERIDAVRDYITRHAAKEEDGTFTRLAGKLDEDGLCQMGRQFASARGKLLMLEQAKAA